MKTKTLLMRLQGIQSWGIRSRFPYQRDTADHPTKSGVLGLVACALGRDRGHDNSDLSALRFGYRVDVAPRLWADFHTVMHARRAKGDTKPQHVTTRHYLSPEAIYLAGLEGNGQLLTRVEMALREPAWMPYLGRRACIPMAPIHLPDGLRGQDLETALCSYPWLGSGDAPQQLQVELPTANFVGAVQRQDQPLGDRRFAQRNVRVFDIALPAAPSE